MARLKFEVTDIEALEKAHPHAVRTVKQADAATVRQLIKAASVLRQEVPGVKILTESEPAPETTPAPEGNELADIPAFLQKPQA